jgi:hypothetical protein
VDYETEQRPESELRNEMTGRHEEEAKIPANLRCSIGTVWVWDELGLG